MKPDCLGLLPLQVRHVKRGTVYTVIGHGFLQTAQPVGDQTGLVIYEAQDGSRWARPAAEFYDGRFTNVNSAETVGSYGPCRECGIRHIEPGTTIDGEPLCWADDDLCSRCQDFLQKALEADAARYRYLRNRQTLPADMAAGGVFAGRMPDNVILGGEDLDRAIDAELGVKPVGETLEARLADCLAACIDTPLLAGRDEVGGYSSPLEIRLGFFRPDLSERAAELLEEAGR